MNSFLQLLKYKTVLFFRLETGINISRVIKDFGTFLVYASFTFGTYVFTLKSIEYVLETMKIGKFLLHEFLSIIFFVFFTAVNVGNIVVSYSTMFKSSEAQFLFSKPILHRSIFAIKLLDNIFYSSGTLFLIMLAFFAGYTTYFNQSPEIIIFAMVFNFLPFVIISACLGVIILMIIIYTSTKIGLQNIIIISALIYLSAIFLFFDQTSPRTIVQEVMKNYPHIDFYFLNALPEFVRYLPNNWLASSLYWNSVGNSGLSISYSLFQFLIGVFTFLLTVTVGGKYYYSLWLMVPAIKKRRKKKLTSKNMTGKNINIKSISPLRKDIILFFREPSQVLHLFVFLILIIFFSGSIESVNSIIPKDFELRTIIFFSVQLFIILFITTLSIRFIFPQISLEGNNFWKIKTSPFQLKKLFLIKYFPMQLFILTIALMLSVFTNKSYESYVFWSSIVIIGISSVFIGSLNFIFGSVFTMYNEKSPIRISSSKGASLTFLISTFYMILLLILLYEPTLISFREIQFENSLTKNRFVIPIAILLVITIISSLLAYYAFIKNMNKDY